VLIENVRHHVTEEEEDVFPKVRDELGRSALNELGDVMVTAKKTAPTHPHPTSPDTPPGNLLAGAAAGITDLVSDTVSGVGQGSVNAIGDLIASILRRDRPSVSPTGSTRARKTAASVRKRASGVTETTTDAIQDAAATATRVGSSVEDGVEATATSAARATRSTARAAKSGAQGTATSARKSAKKTRSTAKRATTTTARTARAGATSTTRPSAPRSAPRRPPPPADRAADRMNRTTEPPRREVRRFVASVGPAPVVAQIGSDEAQVVRMSA
jgi:hypothetical protein